MVLAASPLRPEKPIFTCVVYGQPAPKGSKRHVGNGIMIESSKALEPWMEAVKSAARRKVDRHPLHPRLNRTWPLNEPLRAEIIFTVRKPTSAPKRRRTWPDRYPDVDKMLRGVFDALTQAGIVIDDGRFVLVTTAKVFPGEDPDALDSPGVVIRLYRMEET